MCKLRVHAGQIESFDRATESDIFYDVVYPIQFMRALNDLLYHLTYIH